MGHGGQLRAIAGGDLAVLVRRDYRNAGLDPAEVEMLSYAEKLTLDPGSITVDDVDQLRAVGFVDEEILSICAVTAYHNFNVRMADGLGVKLEVKSDDIDADFRNRLLNRS